MCKKNCKKDHIFIGEDGKIIDEKKKEFNKCMESCEDKKKSNKRKLVDLFDFIKKDPRYLSLANSD